MSIIAQSPQKVKTPTPRRRTAFPKGLQQSSNGVVEQANGSLWNSGYGELPESLRVSRDDWCKASALLGELLAAQAPALFQRYQQSPSNAVRLLRLLLLLAMRIVNVRNYSPATSQVTFHLPLELLAGAMRISRWTVWRKLRELESCGLVATANHYDSLDGHAAISGKIWAVRLKPGRAKITHEDLVHGWRNLEADRDMGTTAYAACKMGRVDFGLLIDWVLGNRHSDSDVPLSQELEQLEELCELNERDKWRLIDRLSAFIAGVLHDTNSQNYYAKILWQVARRSLPANHVKLAFRVARNARLDNWALAPGAIFVNYLRGC